MNQTSGATTTALEHAAELFRNAKRIVALTGAGVSTPSGIPDFRSEGTGLWSSDEPMEVASLNTFRTHPERFFNWFRPLAKLMFHAMPNPAHEALNALEQPGREITIVTQNIDGLHQKAGSKHVIEMHGTLSTLSCTGCFKKFEAGDFLHSFIEHGTIPLCTNCNGVLKPDVILFGEQLPRSAWMEAQNAVRQCDLMVVVGSSLEVLPVAGLPVQAVDRGAHLIVINDTPTYINVRADVVMTEDIATVLPNITKRAIHG